MFAWSAIRSTVSWHETDRQSARFLIERRFQRLLAVGPGMNCSPDKLSLPRKALAWAKAPTKGQRNGSTSARPRRGLPPRPTIAIATTQAHGKDYSPTQGPGIIYNPVKLSPHARPRHGLNPSPKANATAAPTQGHGTDYHPDQL